MKVDKSKWRTLQLKAIGKIISGATPRTDNPANWEGGNLNWVTPAELNGSKYYGETIKKITSEATLHSNVTLMPAGTVLLSSRAPIGKVSITTVPMYCNQGFKNIVCDETIIYNEYLYYYLIFSNAELNRRGSGATFKEISKKVVESFPVLLPTLEEQKGVAAELDRIQGMIDGYKAQIADLDALAQSIFLDTFGDPVTNPKGWEMKNLSDICDCISTGITYKPENVSEIGTVVLRSGNIQDSELTLNDVVRINVPLKPSQLIKKHDILMCSRNGSARLVGKVALIPKLNEDMTWGAFMTIIRSEYYCYLYHFFKLQAFKGQLGRTKTTTVNQITIGMLKGIQIPLPPLALQELFATRVKAIEELKAKIREQVADCEQVMAERMQEYFS